MGLILGKENLILRRENFWLKVKLLKFRTSRLKNRRMQKADYLNRLSITALRTSNHMFRMAIWDKLPEYIFENFEIAPVKQWWFQSFQKSREWFIQTCGPWLIIQSQKILCIEIAGNQKLTTFMVRYWLEATVWLK